jgi:hypothetical protein
LNLDEAIIFNVWEKRTPQADHFVFWQAETKVLESAFSTYLPYQPTCLNLAPTLPYTLNFYSLAHRWFLSSIWQGFHSNLYWSFIGILLPKTICQKNVWLIIESKLKFIFQYLKSRRFNVIHKALPDPCWLCWVASVLLREP